MGRRERREMERLANGRRPDELSDVGRSWLLRYPTLAAIWPPFNWLIRGIHWLGFTLLIGLRWLFGRPNAPQPPKIPSK